MMLDLGNEMPLNFSLVSWVWWCNLRVETVSLQAEARLEYIEKSIPKEIPEERALKVQRLLECN